MNYRYGRPQGTMRNSRERGDPRKFKPGHGIVVWVRADLDITLATTKVSAAAGQSDSVGGTQGTDANRPTMSATGWLSGPCFDFGSGGTTGLVTPSVDVGNHTIVATIQGNASSQYVTVQNNDGTGGYIFGTNGHSSRVARSGTTSDKTVAVGWLQDGVKRTVARTYGGTHASHLLYKGGVLQATSDSGGTGNPGSAALSGPFYIGVGQAMTTGHRGLMTEYLVLGDAASQSVVTRLSNRSGSLWGAP